MILRPATADDAPALGLLGRTSFCAAFEHLYQPDDLQKFLRQTYSAEAIAAEIAAPDINYRVAEDASGLIGYCKLRTISNYASHSDAKNPAELCQLYTDPAKTGSGIGAALMEWALAEARERGADAIQLSVYAENFGGQRFYQRYGFAKIADVGFWVGDQCDPEFLYELRLD